MEVTKEEEYQAQQLSGNRRGAEKRGKVKVDRKAGRSRLWMALGVKGYDELPGMMTMSVF